MTVSREHGSIQATGCIGFGASDKRMIARRVIELFFVDPATKTGRMWVDVFVENGADTDQTLTVFHRGSLCCENVTKDEWRPDSDCEIQERVILLHEDVEPIRIFQNTVEIAGLDYQLWEHPERHLRPFVGGKNNEDVPFTMWQLGSFPAGERRVLRLQLTMTTETYLTQIGPDAREFYAYGDAILLDRILEDILAYSGSDKISYEEGLRLLLPHRIVPEVLEYLLISVSGSTARWKTTPLTYNFSPQLVPEKYSDTTHWFVAHYPNVSDYQIRVDNTFALRVVERAFAGAPSH